MNETISLASFPHRTCMHWPCGLAVESLPAVCKALGSLPTRLPEPSAWVVSISRCLLCPESKAFYHLSPSPSRPWHTFKSKCVSRHHSKDTKILDEMKSTSSTVQASESSQYSYINLNETESDWGTVWPERLYIFLSGM